MELARPSGSVSVAVKCWASARVTQPDKSNQSVRL